MSDFDFYDYYRRALAADPEPLYRRWWTTLRKLAITVRPLIARAWPFPLRALATIAA